jgi:hypothetical protein
MVPSHGQRRAVLWVSLQAQAMSSVDHVISTSLCAQHCCFPLLRLYVVVCATFSCPRSGWWLGRGSPRAPRRQIGEEALLAVWSSHAVERRGIATSAKLTGPSLGAVSRRVSRKVSGGLVSMVGVGVAGEDASEKRGGRLLDGDSLRRSGLLLTSD